MFVHNQPLTLNLIRSDDDLIFHVVGGCVGGGRAVLQKVNVENLRAKVLK